ncbi:MAG: branched-chain amino acid ABC transporter permease, partial [Candidatus Dormibacteraeota bacterium]|nr:branched-chain amino acid ABC transporter permease [Candidatus Dormibacteraeota bacterium]
MSDRSVPARFLAVVRSTPARRAAWVALWVLLLSMPLYLDSFWEQAGLLTMAAVIAAIGLTVLVGTSGQLSLGHAFFVAVGAYGYAFLA